MGGNLKGELAKENDMGLYEVDLEMVWRVEVDAPCMDDAELIAIGLSPGLPPNSVELSRDVLDVRTSHHWDWVLI